MQQQVATRDRHSDASIDQPAATGRGDDTTRRARATAGSRPARERPSASLLESERLFRATFEQAVIGIAHLSLEGRWLRVNQRLCDILGYDRTELAARTWQDVTHPDDLSADLAHIGRLLAGELDAYELDKRYVRKDGTLVWGHLTLTLVRTLEGDPDYCISMVQDITARKRLEQERARLLQRERTARAEAEAALARVQAGEAEAAEHAEHLRTILETMADGVVVVGQDGCLIHTNHAFRQLLAADRLPCFKATSPAELGPHLDVRDPATGAILPFEDSPVARVLRGEEVAGPLPDIRVRAHDGRELDMSVSAAPLRDGAGHVMAAIVVLHDQTERNRLAHEREMARADELVARQTSERMEQFLAVAAHDLRTPLTATVGYLGLAKRQTEHLADAAQEASPALAPAVAAVRDRLDDADRGAERLARLLTLLFDTSAIRADRLELRRVACDLAALVREQVAGQLAAAPGRAIRLRTPPSGGLVPVEADADRIGQVLANYVTNALKYAPADRPIDVSVGARRGRARVAVRDRGPGIPAEERARVWDLFHRAPGAAARGGTASGVQGVAGGSLGLGLYICKAIVEAHGGQVGVEGAVGEGSTFWFTLPLAGPRSVPRTRQAL